MTNGERALNILHYQPADRLPAVHFGYWPELLEEWIDQGKIPKDILEEHHDGSASDRRLDKLIGWDFNWFSVTGADIGLKPTFEHKVLEELPDGSKRIQNAYGLLERVKPGLTSIPAEDNYLLKDRAAFEELFLPKMQYSPERVNLEYFRNFNESRSYDKPMGLYLGSVLGDIRCMTSVLGMSYLMYDEVEEIKKIRI